MKKITILVDDISQRSTCAFVNPLIKYRHSLEECGWRIQILQKQKESLFDTDIVVIDENYLREKNSKKENFLHMLSKTKSTIVGADLQDSTGTIRWEFLPHVDMYLKNQILSNITLYSKSLYGNRLYTDYYHRNYGILDEDGGKISNVTNEMYSMLTKKLRLGWNSSLANYYFLGDFFKALYRRIGMPIFLNQRIKKVDFEKERPIPVSARMNYNYYRSTIAFQRKHMYELLKDSYDLGRVSRRHYLEEMNNSVAVLSPFGWGEINYRDYEAFLAGTVLVKPDMSHMTTWPDLYKEHETYIPFAWDFSDFFDVLHNAKVWNAKNREIARAGFENYKKHLAGKEAGDLFVNRFNQIFSELK